MAQVAKPAAATVTRSCCAAASGSRRGRCRLAGSRRTSARRLLTNTELDPNDIAFLLGFEEPNSFVRAFRVWERTTPIRWREAIA